MGALVFGCAGPLRYWQAWVYPTLFVAFSAGITVDLLRRDPALLQRRMKADRLPKDRRGPAQLLYVIRTPLALGSYWGLLGSAFMLPVLVWRLLDEERLLARELPGYASYQTRVRHRLIPGLW
jgi:hypothetical protein